MGYFQPNTPFSFFDLNGGIIDRHTPPPFVAERKLRITNIKLKIKVSKKFYPPNSFCHDSYRVSGKFFGRLRIDLYYIFDNKLFENPPKTF